LNEAEEELERTLAAVNANTGCYPPQIVCVLHTQRGAVYQQMGKLHEAEQSMGLAIAAMATSGPEGIPSNSLRELHHNRGILQHSLQRHQDALGSFDAALALDGGSYASLNAKAATLIELGRFDDAVGAATAAVAMNDREADGFRVLVQARIQLGQWRRVVEDLRKFKTKKAETDDAASSGERVGDQPPDTWWHQNYKVALVQAAVEAETAGDIEAALSYLEDGINNIDTSPKTTSAPAATSPEATTTIHQPDAPQLKHMLMTKARLLSSLKGDGEDNSNLLKAVAPLEEVLRFSPQEVPALATLGQILLRLKKHQQAEGYLSRAVDAIEVEAHGGGGGGGGASQTANHDDEIHAIGGSIGTVLFLLGQCRMELGKHGGAAEAFKLLRDYEPSHPRVQDALLMAEAAATATASAADGTSVAAILSTQGGCEGGADTPDKATTAAANDGMNMLGVLQMAEQIASQGNARAAAAEHEAQQKQAQAKEMENDQARAVGGEGCFPLSALQQCTPPTGVDPARREAHLGDAEFHKHFQMDKEQFWKLPKWKQDQKKKALSLF